MLEYYNAIKNKTKLSVNTILEIGSRDGNDALLLSNLFKVPHDRVWIIEPNPDKINEIKIKYPNFNSFEFAISENDGEHEFNQVSGNDVDSGTSSLLNRIDDWYEINKTNKIIVSTLRGTTFLKKINTEIDICKIDVEGHTFEVLKSFENDLHLIKSMHIECEHKQVWENQKLYDDIKAYLQEKDFIEIYFSFCSEHKLQSDSIWVHKNYLS